MYLNYRGRDYHYRKQKSINFIVYYLFDITIPSQPPFDAYNFILLIRVTAQRAACNRSHLNKRSYHIDHSRIYRTFYFLFAKKVYNLS